MAPALAAVRPPGLSFEASEDCTSDARLQPSRFVVRLVNPGGGRGIADGIARGLRDVRGEPTRADGPRRPASRGRGRYSARARAVRARYRPHGTRRGQSRRAGRSRRRTRRACGRPLAKPHDGAPPRHVAARLADSYSRAGRSSAGPGHPARTARSSPALRPHHPSRPGTRSADRLALIQVRSSLGSNRAAHRCRGGCVRGWSSCGRFS